MEEEQSGPRQVSNGVLAVVLWLVTFGLGLECIYLLKEIFLLIYVALGGSIRDAERYALGLICILSIGALADVMQMSKSGVFAHFGSREELQISVIREYHAKFEEEVFFPALTEARGLPRLRALFERWIKRVAMEIDSGCIYISGAVEFDDRPGPVRDALVTMVRAWHEALERAIQADKSALKNAASADKAATIAARTEKVKKHLAQHEAELKDLQAQVEKAESETKQ